VKVQYVSAHTRQSSRTPVAAYIKLWQGEEHREKCEYSVSGALAKLVSSSELGGSGPRVLEESSNGGFNFRLNILVEAEKAAEALSKTRARKEGGDKLLRGNMYVDSGERLASYLNSASSLARLRGLIQESSDIELLKKLVKLQYRGKTLSWNDFFYDESRYRALYQKLEKKKVDHPVALAVTVKEAKRGPSSKFPFVFQCYSQIHDSPEERLIYVPWLRTPKEEVAGRIEGGRAYFIVARAWAYPEKDPSVRFRGINIALFHRSQLKRELDCQENA